MACMDLIKILRFSLEDIKGNFVRIDEWCFKGDVEVKFSNLKCLLHFSLQDYERQSGIELFGDSIRGWISVQNSDFQVNLFCNYLWIYYLGHVFDVCTM